MENKAPDILAELGEIETKYGQPWEPEPFGKFSAVLSNASRKFAAHIMLESNLVSGMEATIAIKFDDFPEASEVFNEGAEFTVADRGCRCKGKVVTVYPHPESTVRHADRDIEIVPPPPLVHADNESIPAAKENWVPPKELAHPIPRPCVPTAKYYVWRLYFIFSGVALIVVYALIFVCVFGKLSAMKSLQESGVPVDGTVISSVEYAGRATSKGSTPAHFVVEYSYEVEENAQSATKKNLYHGSGQWKRSSHSAAQVAPGKTAPVVYDPAEPQRSMLVGDLDLEDYGIIRAFGVFIVVLSIAGSAFFVMLLHRGFLRGRRLLMWGQVARATLLDIKQAGRRQNAWMATYVFRDNRGALVKFSQHKTADETGQFDEQLTVLFDPNNSANAAAYPLKVVELQTTLP